MRLDGQEPVVLVRFAAGLDGDETGAEPCGDRGISDSGELKFAIAVTDAGNGSDDGGGSRAVGFGEFSGGVSGEDFVDGELAFFRGDAHLPKQSQSGVKRDAGQDCSPERRSGRLAVPHKEYVHVT